MEDKGMRITVLGIFAIIAAAIVAVFIVKTLTNGHNQGSQQQSGPQAS